MVERRPYKTVVDGSIPAGPTRDKFPSRRYGNLSLIPGPDGIEGRERNARRRAFRCAAPRYPGGARGIPSGPTISKNPKMKKYIIEQKDTGTRLDVFLTSQLKGISRSRIQKVIKEGQVTVNGKPVTPHLAMEENDVVVLAKIPQSSTKMMKMESRADIGLDVIYEDAEIAVINKPSGLLVHPSPQNEEETLAHALLGRWPKIAKVGESTERPGIVHRLDKEASGLLVVAKTQKAYENLKEQFKVHSIKKEYTVLVHGSPAKDEGSISLAIGRAASGDKMAARAEAMEGDRTALTHYRVEEKFPHAALLKVWTETGRTHQIRAHFKALGCPVVGDPLYVLKQGARVSAPRLFLHAKMLGFNHPKTGEWMQFETPLPKDLADFLKSLQKK